jgi:hypothetical protein
MKIMKNNKVQTLEMKTLINQMQTTADSVISRQDQTEERLSEMEDNIDGVIACQQSQRKNCTRHMTYKNSGT